MLCSARNLLSCMFFMHTITCIVPFAPSLHTISSIRRFINDSTSSRKRIHRVIINKGTGTLLQVASRGQQEDIYAAIHRKEYEMKGLNAQHAAISDPIRMAMGYAQDGVERKRLAAALRRVYDDPNNIANWKGKTNYWKMD